MEMIVCFESFLALKKCLFDTGTVKKTKWNFPYFPIKVENTEVYK